MKTLMEESAVVAAAVEELVRPPPMVGPCSTAAVEELVEVEEV